MNYGEKEVLEAFKLYSLLARDGKADEAAVKQYIAEPDIKSLLEKFAQAVDCVIIPTADHLHMIPASRLSPFHVSNEWIKRNYLRSDAVNVDIYLLYFASIVLFGAFFDDYNRSDPVLDFLPLADWVERVNERIIYLQNHDEETLQQLEGEYSYNWLAIIAKWEDMDDIKESAKRQTGRTISRFSFIDRTKRFLIEQGLLEDIGNNEVTLTEKTKVIIQRYFMDEMYNQEILAFIYGDEEEAEHGDNQ